MRPLNPRSFVTKVMSMMLDTGYLLKDTVASIDNMRKRVFKILCPNLKNCIMNITIRYVQIN